MNNPFTDMDNCVNKFFTVIDNLTEGKMTKPIIEVESISPHYYVKKDGEVVAIFNDILRPDALTQAYELKKKLEKGE